MRNLITLSTFVLITHLCFAQEEWLGELGKKYGTILTVRGIVIDGFHKGYESGPNLIVQVIGDSSIQNFLRIPLSPLCGDFEGEPCYGLHGRELHKSPPKIEYNATYLLRVYETGEFAGVPWEADKEAGILRQTSNLYFRNELIVISGEKIDPIESSPSEFVERNALISGIAKNERDTAVIESTKWKLRLIGNSKWTSSEVGKLAEVYGIIKRSKINDCYDVHKGRVRLVKLEDQLGKIVKLRGTVMNVNQRWWFNYRNIELYIEKMEDWSGIQSGDEIEVTGILEQGKFPDLGQFWKDNPDRTLQYIVRKASWKQTDELLIPERVLDW